MSGYYSSSSRTSPFIVDARPSRASSARVCYHSAPAPLYTYTNVVVVKRRSKVNRPKESIVSFDRDFARASSQEYSSPRGQYRDAAQANPDRYSLSRWVHESSREAPYSAPHRSSTSYAQARYENESSREQPWNVIRAVPTVRATEPKVTRTIRSSTSHSVGYYDGQLGGHKGASHRAREGVFYRTR